MSFKHPAAKIHEDPEAQAVKRYEQLDHAWAVICSERGALGVYCFQRTNLSEANAGCVMAIFPTRREAREAKKGRYFPARVAKVRVVLEEVAS